MNPRRDRDHIYQKQKAYTNHPFPEPSCRARAISTRLPQSFGLRFALPSTFGGAAGPHPFHSLRLTLAVAPSRPPISTCPPLRSRAGTHALTTAHPELLRLAAPQLRPLRPKCSPLKPSCRQAPPAARVERNSLHAASRRRMLQHQMKRIDSIAGCRRQSDESSLSCFLYIFAPPTQ